MADNKERPKGCSMGLITGSAIKALTYLFDGLFQFIGRIMMFLGLWIPFLYAFFGLILYGLFRFNPFDKSLNATLYLIGFGLTVLCALIISVKNLIIKPFKSIREGYKNPVWVRDKNGKVVAAPEAEEPTREPTPYTKNEEPPEAVYARPEAERPKIYYSKREKDTLIHEYSDRFEVYRVIEGKPLLHKVEYKNYDL